MLSQVYHKSFPLSLFNPAEGGLTLAKNEWKFIWVFSFQRGESLGKS